MSEFTLHIGPMKSEKTKALIGALKKFSYAGYDVIGIKPGAELRDDGIASRNGERYDAITLEELGEWPTRFALDDVEVIGVDEMFMFDAEDAYGNVMKWREAGKIVVGATLDLSAMGKPMTTYTRLLQAGPKVVQHEAVCVSESCGDMHARFTQIRDLKTNNVIREGLAELVPEDPQNPKYAYNPVCFDCFYYAD